MEKNRHLDWMLLVVRMTVGTAFVIHGGRRVLATVGTMGVHTWAPYHYIFSLTANLTSLIEFIGGGLILIGALVEIGTLLVIPAAFFAFFVNNLSGQTFANPTRPQSILNLVILAIAVVICGPGKWALWDPGKYWRKKIFEPDQSL